MVPRLLTINPLEKLAAELTRSGRLRHFTMTYPQQVQRWESDGQAEKVFPYEMRAKLDLGTILKVRRVIRDVRPDIVHAFHSRPLAHAVLATAGMKNRPAIVSFRMIATPPARLDPANQITFLSSKITAHACEAEASARGLMASGIPKQLCHVIHNYVTPIESRPGRAGLQRWGIPGDAFVVGVVAAMRPVKGIDILLKAAAECGDLSNVHWVLIGAVRDQQILRLAQHERIRDRVHFLGFQSNASELISGADLFVLPSRSEGIPRALLEAMSQSVCPVVSDAGGMPEAVRHETDGLVVPREDVTALAAAIRRLYHDDSLRQSFAESASHRAKTVFTPEQMCLRTLLLYERILAGEFAVRRAA